MKRVVIWGAIYTLMAVAASSVVSSYFTLSAVAKEGAAGSAAEDILGLGLLPVWAPVCLLLAVLVLLARKILRPLQITIVIGAFLVLLVIDWEIQRQMQFAIGL